MELVKVLYNGTGVEAQTYSQTDDRLITSNFINTSFGDTNDYIEAFFYDDNNVLLNSNYNLTRYKPNYTNNLGVYDNIQLDPESDAFDAGYNRGSVNIQYNFLKNLFNSAYGNFYWIKEISTSRTEIKLTSQTLSNSQIKSGFDSYQSYISTKNYYSDFYLNFGSNDLVIAVNSAYTEDANGAYLLIKLYEPLPIDFDVKTTLWIVDKLAESVAYNVNVQVESVNEANQFPLRGPNFKIDVNQKIGQTTPYYNYANLISSPVSSSFQQLNSYYQDKSVEINVDYSNFSNFIHFSSATERLNNFTYKLGLIESYNAQIGAQRSVVGGNTVTSSSIGFLSESINNIITKFDTYEYYLYYTSASFAWPKRNSTMPYSLYSITSSQAIRWLGSSETKPTLTSNSLLYSASYYDLTNKDLLANSIPLFIQDDPNNSPYVTFLYMIGQHFDNIWIYYKDVTNRYNNTNNPFTGISKDLVADALKGLGVQLYTNSSISDNLYYSLFGINADGSLLPPTGSEKITNYVTSSLNTLPGNQIQGEIYKRLYHNLPYLLKTKGTQRGLKALIACFGIPNSILTVNEFGGYDRYLQDGVLEINNNKAYVVTSSLQISSSLLSPFVTIQYPQTNRRIDTANIEVGFSPSDEINSNITSSLGYFNIDQLIGNPTDQYSSSYSRLDSYRDTYFQSYTNNHTVWEYIRLIKFFNNSLFKMVKDFVPARANLSTGIIVKPHILERNKYARHEPELKITSLSQSIHEHSITGGLSPYIYNDTTTYKSYPTQLGYVQMTSSVGYEKFTGQYQGTNFSASSLNSVGKQTERSNFSSASFNQIDITINALRNNVSSSVRSKRFYDLDYAYNQNVPVNLGLITQSLIESQTDNFGTYNNPYSPYAYVQDYNYYTNHFTIPRYYGSKTISANYNVYADGDTSYGHSAAIDKYKKQFAYILSIHSKPFQLPGRSNIQIKYIIDDNQNVLNLSKTNTNIFTTQNIFVGGENMEVALDNFDPTDPNIAYLTNNKKFTIYEGGFNYSPILYNTIAAATLDYKYVTPFVKQSTISVPGGITQNTISLSNFTSTVAFDQAGTNSATITITYIPSGPIPNYDIYGEIGGRRISDSTIYDFNYYRMFSANSSNHTFIQTLYDVDDIIFTSAWYNTNQPNGSSTTYEYITGSTDSNPRWWAEGQTRIHMSATQSLYYGEFIQTGSISGLDTPVFPFQLAQGDMIRFYDTLIGWSQNSEYRVVDVQASLQASGSNGILYKYFTLDRPLNITNTDSGAFPSYISKYIVLKHIPDETNVIANFNFPTLNTQQSFLINVGSQTYVNQNNAASSIGNQYGLLIPQYLSQSVADNAGNIVKALRAQNLIQ
jgi:hypothetical protein